MRLGGPVQADWRDAQAWVAAHRSAGYSAAYFPGDPKMTEAEERALADAARRAGLVLAEVGAWSNPLSSDSAARREALNKCKRMLARADRVAARCCVNITGSRGAKWDGPDPRDLTDETFDMIVASVRDIIDSVKPVRSFYTLETMPWMYPDSAESYQRLLKAIDRPAAAVHLDPVNLICSPRLFFDTGAVIRDFVARLGPRIRSCHGKDILLRNNLTTHLDEVPPGQGGLDYPCYLGELSRLDPDTPLMLEHMKPEQYPAAAEHVRRVAARVGVTIL
ncbi:MAG: hypothetical protein BIFFINMI_03228 [Phycisphaerae bacterium]|nr:hypothetical protein [Phycisphaerae bacterium]